MTKRGRLACAVLVGLALVGGPTAANAQLYRWVDENGRLHISDDLSQVPDEQRAQVELDGTNRTDESNWNAVDPGAVAVPATADPSRESIAPRRHEIPVARAGLELSVQAVLDGGVEVGFKVDTGATLNTIPRTVVEEMGIEIGEQSPMTVVVGISGDPMIVPIVTVDEVRLGTATVRRVDFAVLDTMAYGLLGMPFFNHFRVQTDPTRGMLTLEEIDLNAIDGIYGGYDERHWRTRFALINGQIERIETLARKVPTEYTTTHERVRKVADYWREQREILDLKATRAGVPQPWRE